MDQSRLTERKGEVVVFIRQVMHIQITDPRDLLSHEATLILLARSSEPGQNANQGFQTLL